MRRKVDIEILTEYQGLINNQPLLNMDFKLIRKKIVRKKLKRFEMNEEI